MKSFALALSSFLLAATLSSAQPGNVVVHLGDRPPDDGTTPSCGDVIVFDLDIPASPVNDNLDLATVFAALPPDLRFEGNGVSVFRPGSLPGPSATVNSGASEMDRALDVDLGNICTRASCGNPDGTPARVTFRAEIVYVPGLTEYCVRAQAQGDNFSLVLSDNPATSGPPDAT